MRILFYTCIFTDDGRLPQDEPGPFERMKGCDYLCLHNCPTLAQDRTSWRLIHVRELPKGMPGRVFSRMVGPEVLESVHHHVDAVGRHAPPEPPLGVGGAPVGVAVVGNGAEPPPERLGRRVGLGEPLL